MADGMGGEGGGGMLWDALTEEGGGMRKEREGMEGGGVGAGARGGSGAEESREMINFVQKRCRHPEGCYTVGDREGGQRGRERARESERQGGRERALDKDVALRKR
jgi:hypothetical protein